MHFNYSVEIPSISRIIDLGPLRAICAYPKTFLNLTSTMKGCKLTPLFSWQHS